IRFVFARKMGIPLIAEPMSKLNLSFSRNSSLGSATLWKIENRFNGFRICKCDALGKPLRRFAGLSCAMVPKLKLGRNAKLKKLPNFEICIKEKIPLSSCRGKLDRRAAGSEMKTARPEHLSASVQKAAKYSGRSPG